MHPKGINPLRGAEGGCAPARLEQGSKSWTLSAKNKTGPLGPFQFFGGEGVPRTEFLNVPVSSGSLVASTHTSK